MKKIVWAFLATMLATTSYAANFLTPDLGFADVVDTTITPPPTPPAPPAPPKPPKAPKAPKAEGNMVWMTTDKEAVPMGNGDFQFTTSDSSKPMKKEVRVEVMNENGQETTKIWVNGKPLDPQSEEYQVLVKEMKEGKTAVFEGENGEKIVVKERKNGDKESKEIQVWVEDDGTESGQKIIVNGDEMEGEKLEFTGEDGQKIIFIEKEEIKKGKKKNKKKIKRKVIIQEEEN